MSYFTADVSNLDSATRDYLAEVAREKGGGAPGVFVAGRTNAWPVISFFAGGIILVVGLILAFSATKAPWATAMLVTAVILLGGWMVLYPFRRALGGGLGTFQYFDPVSIYESNGRDITVTDISELSNLNVVEHFNDGNYQHTNLTFRIPGKPRMIAVVSRNKADTVANYYANVLGLRDEENIDDIAELGATAKYIAKEGERPTSIKLLDLTIHTVPESPSASKKAGFALRFLAIVGIAAAIFAGSWMLLSPVQDDMVFAEAKNHGVQGYRDYLLDDRHTRHRDEAKAKIAELYQPLIARTATIPDDKDRQGWKDVLEGLAQCEGIPVVSIRVIEDGSMPAEAASRQKQMQTWLADAIGSHFGPTYIAFVEAPADIVPHLEINYRLPSTQQGTFEWQATYRRTPESEPVVGPRLTVQGQVTGLFPHDDFKRAYFQRTFASPVPNIHTAPVSGGDFE